jgi:F-type H+-transporting ATPase subunit b
MVWDPEGWVLVCFLIFVAIVLYLGVPRIVAKALDSRADGIRKEIEEARRLKEEAAALLADYKKRREEADKEAEEIVAQAKHEAETYAIEARANLKDFIERQTKQVEDKISRAEGQATSEVRAAAIEAAVKAARSLIASKLDGGPASSLIEKSIQDLQGRLN